MTPDHDDPNRPRLDPLAARILGVLVEKQMTTPDVYPLTLAGVVAGSNQSTNRDPVMSVTEDEVEPTLVALHDAGLATPVRRSGDRATKYRHKLGEYFEIDESAQAVLAVLLLRGPQTSGELRTRTERYVSLANIDEVELVIDRLEEAGLARRLARLPGQSQRRVSELLSDDQTKSAEADSSDDVIQKVRPTENLPLGEAAAIEARMSRLERRFEELLEQLGVEDI